MLDGLSVNTLAKECIGGGIAACPINGQRNAILPCAVNAVKMRMALKLFPKAKQTGREFRRFAALLILSKFNHFAGIGHTFYR